MAAKFSVNRKACRFQKPSPLGGKVLNEVKRMRGDLLAGSRKLRNKKQGLLPENAAAAFLRPHPSAHCVRIHLFPTLSLSQHLSPAGESLSRPGEGFSAYGTVSGQPQSLSVS